MGKVKGKQEQDPICKVPDKNLVDVEGFDVGNFDNPVNEKPVRVFEVV